MDIVTLFNGRLQVAIISIDQTISEVVAKVVVSKFMVNQFVWLEKKCLIPLWSLRIIFDVVNAITICSYWWPKYRKKFPFLLNKLATITTYIIHRLLRLEYIYLCCKISKYRFWIFPYVGVLCAKWRGKEGRIADNAVYGSIEKFIARLLLKILWELEKFKNFP